MDSGPCQRSGMAYIYTYWELLMNCNYLLFGVYIYICINIYIHKNIYIYISRWMSLWRDPPQIFDEVLSSSLLYFVIVTLADPAAVFQSFFSPNLDHGWATLANYKTSFSLMEHLLKAASTDSCFRLCYYYFAATFVLLLRK